MSKVLTEVYKRNRDFPWQTINDETIIIDPATQSSFELNSLGSFVWNQIDGKLSLIDICQRVEDEYDVGSSPLQDDIASLTTDLIENKLIMRVV